MGKHSRIGLLIGIAATALSAGAAYAGVIPYPNAGTPITTATYNLTAASTGHIEGYFYTFSASDTEYVSMTVNGTPTGLFGLDNQTSTPGQAFDLGNVTKGDKIVFFIDDTSQADDLYSAASLNADGYNHAYITWYSGTGGPAGIPAGTYVGFEDRLQSQGSDFDYNDDQFVFTGVATPEPTTWAMMLVGFGGLGFAALRRSRKPSVSIA